MKCMGDYEIKFPVYEKIIDQKKGIHVDASYIIDPCICTKMFNLM